MDLKKEINKLRVKYLIFILKEFFLYLIALVLFELSLILLIEKFYGIKLYKSIIYILPLSIFLLFIILNKNKIKTFSLYKFSIFIETKFPHFKSELSSAMQFQSNLPFYNKLYSNDLIFALFEKISKEIKNIDISKLFDTKKFKKIYTLILVICLLFTSIYIYPTPPKVNIKSSATQRKQEKSINIIPKIFDIKLKFIYPEYTEQSSEQVDGSISKFSVIKGTKLIFSAKYTEKIKDAFILINNNNKLSANFADGEIYSEWNLFSPVNFNCNVVANNQKIVQTKSFEIDIIPDEYPKVEIINQEQEILLPEEKFISLNITASDDFKVTKMRIKYKSEKLENITSLEITPSPIIEQEIKWNLENLLGDEKPITFYVEVEDNDLISGPKIARTDIYQIIIPPSFKILENIKEEQFDIQEKIENITERQKDLIEDVENLSAKIKTQKNFSLDEKKNLSDIISKQKQIEDDIKEIKDKLSGVQEKDILNPKTLKAIKDLNTLLNIVLSDDLKQILQDLQNAIDNISLSEAEKNLLDAKFKQEEFLKKIEQTLNLFKRAFLEQRLLQLSKQLQELKKRQDNITEKLELLEKSQDLEYVKKGAFSELSYKQRKIKEEQEQIEKEIKNLSSEFFEISKEVSKNLKETQKFLEEINIPSKMQELWQNLSKFDSKNSLNISQDISDNLFQLSQKLRDTYHSMLKEYRESLTYDVNNLIRKGLLISEKQEDISANTKKLIGYTQMEVLSKEKSEILKLIFEQKKLQKYTQGFIKDILDVANKSFLVNPYLSTQVEMLSQLMQSVVENLEDGNIQNSYQLSQKTMAEINKLVKELLKLEEKTKSATASMSLEEYLRKLEALAEAQKNLNEKTQKCGGGMPYPFDLTQLAYEQQKIREGLERLLEKMRGCELPSNKMLQGTPDTMKEIESKILKQEFGRELEKKQEKVLNKLLDAQRSLQIQGKEEGFESETAKEYKIEKPKEIEYVKKKTTPPFKKFDDLSSGYPKKFKNLLEKYFKVIYTEIFH